MQTILYTDTDQVRSALGLDAEDMSDAMITSRNLEMELSLDLAGWIPTHSSLYAAGIANTATEEEKNVSSSLVLYSTYFCCDLVFDSVQMAAPQSVSDGKNSMSRFTPQDWQKIEDRIKARKASYKKMAQELSSSFTGIRIKLFAGVNLATDPVIST